MKHIIKPQSLLPTGRRQKNVEKVLRQTNKISLVQVQHFSASKACDLTVCYSLGVQETASGKEIWVQDFIGELRNNVVRGKGSKIRQREKLS